MAQAIRHPLAQNRLYSIEDDGRVRVWADGVSPETEHWGLFDNCGRWLGGKLRHADPQMCRFIFARWILNQATAKG
ncbi:hypothetical protein [Frankia sp. CcI49]|uniref:hypothetical protein n=1 Tax=Frankia sp. CcI49 TaxID=1745382 RepID=UPI000977124E|nr:hypothetical protein [Frankia sp. CcI49]